MTEPVLTKRQLAMRLQVSTRTIERHIRPYMRVGGQNRYTLTDARAQLKGVPETGGTVVAFPNRKDAA